MSTPMEMPSRPSVSSYQPAAASSRPAYRPPARPAARGGGGGGIDLGPLKEPKVLGGIAGAAAFGLVAYWFMFAPPGTGKEKQYLATLKEIGSEFAELREKGGDFSPLKGRIDKEIKPMIKDLKQSANRKYPYRQQLLWSAEGALTEMMSTGVSSRKEGPAEQQFKANLAAAEKLMGGG
jgi:hypothetical protein